MKAADGARWGAVALAVALGAGTARGDAEADAVRGQLHAATYQASALGHAARGAAVWLQDDDGNLRLELDRQPDGPVWDRAAILSQRGQGWTVVLAATGGGTANAWGEQWRTVSGGIADAVRLTTAELGRGSDTGEPNERFASGHQAAWRAGRGLPLGSRHPVASLAKADSSGVSRARAWRGRQTLTGLGRGPGGELLVLTWLPRGTTAESRLEARLSGRPGRVVLTRLPSDSVSYFMPEAFVPLWPLGDALADTP